MKVTDKGKSIPTIPNGVWESSRPTQKQEKNNKENNLTTDWQGNGYPVHKQSK